MPENNLLLVKFGGKKHLELLKEGCLYSNPIQKYRNDGTVFRGDKNEGIVPIDPSKISIKDKDGKEWFTDLMLPRPTSVLQSIQGDENTFIFCSAMITKDILITSCEEKSNPLVFCDEFKKAVQPFGDYALIFSAAEICGRLTEAKKIAPYPLGYISGPIIYRDLNDFSEASKYHTAYNVSGSEYDRYFVKNLSYRNQNEWRLIIDGSEKPLEANCGDGFSIHIGKLDWAYLFDTPTFLNTFQSNDD